MFKILPTEEKLECPKRKTIFIEENGFIESPKFGNKRKYDLNLNCQWILKSAQSGVIYLCSLKNFLLIVLFENIDE